MHENGISPQMIKMWITTIIIIIISIKAFFKFIYGNLVNYLNEEIKSV